MIARSDGQTFGPYTYRGEDAVYVFLRYLLNHEIEMREDMANKRPLVMTNKDWQKYRNATECHICNKSLYKDLYLDSMEVYDPDSGKYCVQSHRRCYYQAAKNRYAPREIRKPKDAIDKWITINQETCLFCADPLLVPNFKDSVRDHDHMTGKYRGAAHNECNFKLKLNPKTMPIPVIFHNLKGYDGHLLMQAMARVRGEIKCIPTNTEKYISFSLGNLRFVDSVNFLLSRLDKLVKGIDEFPIMNKLMPEENKRQLQIMKMKCNSKKGWILEVDLEYPAHLHDAYNDYPLAPEKKVISLEQMSEYQRRLMADLDLTMPNTEKLVLTLEDKEKYVVHYSNLQLYLRQGMRLKKVHRVIEFDQEPWMEPYIRMNTEFRKQAKSDFETDFYKLMNNSVFGKTMENLRNRVDVKIVRNWETDKIRKLLSSPSFVRSTSLETIWQAYICAKQSWC